MNRKYFSAFMALSAMALLVSSPATAHDGDPTDPYASVPPLQYRSIIGEYKKIPVVTRPDTWRELNDRAEKIGGQRGQMREQNAPIRKRKRR